MSDKIYDNFDDIEVSEDGTSTEYKNSSNCFGVSEVIELSVAGVTNNFIKMKQLMNIVYNIDFEGNSCEDTVDLVNAIDDFANDNPFMNKLTDVIMCYIFESLDFETMFNEVVDKMDYTSNILDDIIEYKNDIEDLVNFNEDIDLASLDDFDDVLIENFEAESETLDLKINEFMTIFVTDFCDKYMVNEEQKIEMLSQFDDFSVVDFTDISDLANTVKGVFKTVFILENEDGEGGIIGDSTDMWFMDLEDYIEMFINTYYSIFEYLLTDFSVDFSNLESFFSDADSDNNQNIRFMFYIFDSLKYDAQFLKQKIILESLYDANMHDGHFLSKDVVIGHKETETEIKQVSNIITTHADVYVCPYDEDGTMSEPVLYETNVLVGKEIYAFKKTTTKIGGYFLNENPELELNRDNLKSYLVSKFNNCLFEDVDVDGFINKFMNRYINWYWERFSEFGSVFEEVRTSGHEFVDVFTAPTDFCKTRNIHSVEEGNYTDVHGYIVQKPTVKLFYLELFNYRHLLNGGDGGIREFREFFILGIKDFIDFENFLGLIDLENEDSLIDIADDFVSELADDISEFVNDIFQ